MVNNSTIVDIAELAETSVATVSRVINNKGYVSELTRIQVEKAISKLNYIPRVISMSNAKKNLRNVGILVPDLNNYFYPLELMGIEKELEKKEYNIFLCNTYEQIDKEMKYIANLLKKGVDGIILVGSRSTHINNEHVVALAEKIPVVMTNDFIVGSNVYSVMIDVVNGAFKAVKHLIDLGHKKIAFINGNSEYSTFAYKYKGYQQALTNENIEVPSKYIVNETPYETGGFAGMQKLLALNDPPTAVFTASDQMAVGGISAIYKAGLQVPGDISLVGFSNIPLSEHLHPSLTTIDAYPYRVGKLAAETMINVLNHKKQDSRKIILEPQLIERNTCQKLVKD